MPYRHLLADEYQDLTADQAMLIQALAPLMKTVLVMGDQYQTVYGFAGATFTPLKSFLAGTRRMRLTQTHRFKGRFPHYRAVTTRQVERERNLFYVAVTWARRGMYVFEAPCKQPKVKEPFAERSDFLRAAATRDCFRHIDRAA